MTSNTKHFEEKPPTAVLKHGVLKYLHPFVAMTSTSSDGNRVWFIDAYAGAGKFDDGSPGSPLIALGVANGAARFPSPRDTRCVFIERKKAYYEQLCGLAEEASTAAPPILLYGDSAVRLAEAVALAGDDPLLTFLDPFGAALPRDIIIKQLMSRRGINEILLNFHINTVARIGAATAVGDALTPEQKKTAILLDTFLGYEGWRETFREHYRKGDERSATAAALVVSEEYRQRILRETGYRSFVVDIREAPHHVPKFQLTLFLRGDTPAEYKFADAASHANVDWRKRLNEDAARADAEKYSGTLEGLGQEFSREQFDQRWKESERMLANDWVGVLKSNLRALTAHGHPVKVSSNVRGIYGELLGLAGETHFRRAWKELAADGVLESPPAKLHYAVVRRITGGATTAVR
ncbi:three-Cys-motif partner protein TcmP [Microbacterium sp. E-13]|uniref:three-Cys-motif partner protein TcmP n=1 Tax=Microbacterium sp. E-13 TaxID=3404048 RepID=UPI003CF45547